jgi:hypothetical protein
MLDAWAAETATTMATVAEEVTAEHIEFGQSNPDSPRN